MESLSTIFFKVRKIVFLSLVFTTLGLANSAETNSVKFLGGEIKSEIEFITYYRSSGLIEITGNEQTFSAGIRLDFDYIKTFKNLDFKLSTDILILEQLSLKGRLYENFNPPALIFNEANITLPIVSWTYFKMGILKPLLNVLPMRNYFFPVVFKTGPNTYSFNSNLPGNQFNTINLANNSYVNFAFVTGNRDDPLPYIIPLQNDTGISWNVEYKALVFSFLFSNGEANLDSNSAKTFSILLGYDDENYDFGIFGQIGNIGSVPIKEFQNLIKGYFYYYQNFGEIDFTVGTEVLLHLHGLRDLGSFNRYLQDEFVYTDGFFSPFTVFNDGSYDASAQIFYEMLYGLSGLIYFNLNVYFFNLTSHFSLYDPNLLTDNSAMYKLRYRIFNRIGFAITPFLDFYFSHTYTHDEVFFSFNQFFDRESRANHPLVDQDFFAGFVFKI